VDKYSVFPEGGGWLFVLERRDRGESCTDHLVQLEFGQTEIESTKEIGYDCCPNRECGNLPPMSWMIRYCRAKEARDLEALRRLIDPHGSLYHVQTSPGGTEGVELDRAELDASVFDRLDEFEIEYADVSCPQSFGSDGTATCEVYEGGFEGRYEFERSSSGVYLTKATEDSH
jgi:hypothetical protein